MVFFQYWIIRRGTNRQAVRKTTGLERSRIVLKLQSQINELFKINQNEDEIAIVSCHKNWPTYAYGYWQAAKFLAENASTLGMQDPFIYPIAFLYRHYLEIQFKNIIILANKLLSREMKYPPKHEFYVLWPIVKSLILEIWHQNKPEEFEIIEKMIFIFNKIDGSSYSFRYPVDKNGKEYLKDIKHINIIYLLEHFEKIGVFLDGICDGIDELL